MCANIAPKAEPASPGLGNIHNLSSVCNIFEFATQFNAHPPPYAILFPYLLASANISCTSYSNANYAEAAISSGFSQNHFFNGSPVCKYCSVIPCIFIFGSPNAAIPIVMYSSSLGFSPIRFVIAL